MTAHIKLALHTWTIDTTPLATALDASKAAGFDAIELRRSDVVQCYERGLSSEAVIKLVQTSGLPLGILGTEYGWFFAAPDEQRRLFDVLRETCAMARALDCSIVMSAPGQLTGTVQQAIAATRTAAEIVGGYGMRLALEFNSQHPVVNRTSVLQEIVGAVGQPHCGLLLDSYHLHRSEGIARGLQGVRAEEIFVIQYSDVPAEPEPGVRRPIDRLPPGDGVLDWHEFFGLLDTIGYSGFLSYEAPNPALWDLSPYDVTAEGIAKTRALLADHRAAAAIS